MKNINQYEVGIQGQAADITFSLVRLNDDRWELKVSFNGPKLSHEQSTGTFLLTNEEAACAMALFVIGDFEDEVFNKLIWNKVERLKSIPKNLSIIP